VIFLPTFEAEEGVSEAENTVLTLNQPVQETVTTLPQETQNASHYPHLQHEVTFFVTWT
jgi:hypothetical protein